MGLSFREPLEEARRKAANVCRDLSGIIQNTPKQGHSLFLQSVLRSTILYAAHIWAKKVKAYRRGITKLSCVLRVISNFRTISEGPS